MDTQGMLTGCPVFPGDVDGATPAPLEGPLRHAVIVAVDAVPFETPWRARWDTRAHGQEERPRGRRLHDVWYFDPGYEPSVVTTPAPVTSLGNREQTARMVRIYNDVVRRHQDT